jgi:signal transduction histidine kinase
MSHELRTPLNSLLILAQQLEDNPDKNMTATQVEYARVIHTSGLELLELLNSILELAKVESGTATAEMTEVSVGELRSSLLREFAPVGQRKRVGFSIDLTTGAPEQIVTDPQRLRQILKNLLANAFKFTEHGKVRVQIGLAANGWNRELESLATAASVVSVAISDTGIGIDKEQQLQIFEAFAQGDGTTARVYGGTGLGLSISRELVGLLGGELTVTSVPGEGSTFTVFLPSDPRGRGLCGSAGSGGARSRGRRPACRPQRGGQERRRDPGASRPATRSRRDGGEAQRAEARSPLPGTGRRPHRRREDSHGRR